MNQFDKENYDYACSSKCIEEGECIECGGCYVHSDCTPWFCIDQLAGDVSLPLGNEGLI
jgi:hypothetical protein